MSGSMLDDMRPAEMSASMRRDIRFTADAARDAQICVSSGSPTDHALVGQPNLPFESGRIIEGQQRVQTRSQWVVAFAHRLFHPRP